MSSPRASSPIPSAPFSCDVLVIGGGIAALCAAIAAREAGASVWMLDQAPRWQRGGNTRHSRNFRVVHDAPTAFSPGSYSEQEFIVELERAAQGGHDPGLARILASGSASLPAWLAGQGVHFQRTGDGALPPSRRTVFCFGGGMVMLNTLYARAQRLGIVVRSDSLVETIRLDGVRVAGITVMEVAGMEVAGMEVAGMEVAGMEVAGAGSTGRYDVHPRAVIACCGGYQAAPDRLRRHWGTASDGFVVRGVPQARGEILFGLLEQGIAAVGEPGACHLVAVDARSPAVDGGIVTRVLGIPAGIVVDSFGRRFHDEAETVGQARYAVWGRLIAECPDQIAYLLLDQAGARDLPPSVFPALQADSIGGLARLGGLDVGSLQATVAGFNASIHPGAARTEGLAPAKTRGAAPIATPPFFAIPMRPGITFTCHGVKVDAQARVMTSEGRPVENLFAAGMIMAPNVLGTGYLAGAGVTIGAVFGRIAGEEAARLVLG